MTASARNRTELGKFLAARRGQLVPELVGLPGGDRRRTPGLRREEVALLAGVGISWYTWIEQGRAKNVSAEILDAIADVLRLDEGQRAYMMELAGRAQTAPAPTPPPDPGAYPTAEEVVAHWMPNPAFVLDRHWNVLSANRSAQTLLDLAPGVTNYLVAFFCTPAARSAHPDWERQAAGAVARFRAQLAAAATSPESEALIAKVSARSPEFKRLWEEYLVGEDSCTVQTIRPPHAGDLLFTRTTLAFTCSSGLNLNLLIPVPGTGTEERLGRLLERPAPLPGRVGLMREACIR
ncbi:helix-turn-helix transcriptional regulator [Glycomyces endophyticus]|uniref:Helix-turn-helix transcriptional regulator n=1 Tax=Glycomyces endophyticus TaxID=480996 RepID=A0ABN2GJJ4_9ACTN